MCVCVCVCVLTIIHGLVLYPEFGICFKLILFPRGSLGLTPGWVTQLFCYLESRAAMASLNSRPVRTGHGKQRLLPVGASQCPGTALSAHISAADC